MSPKNNYNTSQESQQTEWKWSWQDEYLKWLCGYANTEGGTLYIGVNDDGYVVGIEDSKRMLESIPNKIRKVPAKIILTEGLFVLEERIREILDVSIYIHTPEDIIKDRWYKRAGERGKEGKELCRSRPHPCRACRTRHHS